MKKLSNTTKIILGVTALATTAVGAVVAKKKLLEPDYIDDFDFDDDFDDIFDDEDESEEQKEVEA